jgi:hypothetical protein
MEYYVGLDVSLKSTHIWFMDQSTGDVAGETGSQVQIAGARAANALSLSTQVPEEVPN